ncbi:hypothetical protein DDB_G0291818 [Dictyostelium discoideum AX4]|uniref:Uncharacterized protein n=1 Tax=Dictyostelium discoideum TaxID=44689 RepID=Q54E39_DICDI|nr:hypothetical protein DDB_G0291818 [Dictyostelium discoideum AX4]EAL61530.1 hypothetical protein DDB_G0291818 [Dictyostelium discoideum AX4]|eukprot:XP_629948.1 hypothetical protein DDB_G0291818 [Dictyostelium discoideum AX4]
MKTRILLLFLLLSILLNVSFSLDETKNIENNLAAELIPDIGEKNNNNNLELVGLNENEKQKTENVEEISNVVREKQVENKPDVEYEFHQISLEDNLKKIINDIVSISNRNREQDITSLLNYIFNVKPKSEDFKEYNGKQSKFQQMVNYFQSFDEIIKQHQFEIDQDQVRLLAHDFTKAYSSVFELDNDENLQFEDNLTNFLYLSVQKFLSSFGLPEYKPHFERSNLLERDVHRYVSHPDVSYWSNDNVEKIAKASTLTENNIQDISKAIVQLSEGESKYFKNVMEILDIQNAPNRQKVANISSILKTALRIMYSMISKLQTNVDNIDNNENIDNTDNINNDNVVAKYPTWINEEYIKDVDSVSKASELFNPRTIVAFNKLFIRNNDPISKYDQESLTHQFVDLAYSILYGRQQKYEEFAEKGKTASDTNIDPIILNRIISMVDNVQEVSQQENSQGYLLRAARAFFNLFHIRENYDALMNAFEQEQEEQINNINNNNNENTQQQEEQQNDENNQQTKQQKQASSNIQYIAHRVNKIIQENTNIDQGDETKRNENVFRILYNIYLHYYGLEDENQLESNRKVSNKKIENENPEVSFIREIVPSLSENDVVDILEEIDRVADQLGYKSTKIDDIDENDELNNNAGETRDLGDFQYQENEI